MSQKTPIATIGTPTTHGGQVITATATCTISGKKIACVGDQVSCPEHGKGVITDGGFVTIGGKCIARHGSTTSCGATLIVTNDCPTV